MTAPDADPFREQLETAAAWSAERHAAEAWAAYAKVQDELAWDAALVTAAEAQGFFEPALRKDATIAQRYPALAALLAARTDVAGRGAATRQANRKAGSAPPK